MNFGSDNGAGVAPQILDAIVASSRVYAPAYGADEYTGRAQTWMTRQRWDYFVRYLLGTQPPAGYELHLPAGPVAP